MRDATRIFQEAYSGEQRRRSQFGMDHNGEFDPANNPFATGRDPESVEWDDEGGDDDLDDGDAEAELEAALRQARADEMEDEEESEDEDESFAKAGVRDSRRGARQS